MSYATLQDLIERAGQDEILEVADRDGDGVADPDVIAAALIHADNTVNGYVAVAYSVPLQTVPDLIRTWAVSIARYFLHRNGPPSYVVEDWKFAISSLKDVAAEKLQLPVPVNEPAPQPSETGQVSVTGPEPAFSADRLGGWL